MAQAKEHLFCPHSGYLLELDAHNAMAKCTASGFQKNLAGRARGGPCTPAAEVQFHAPEEVSVALLVYMYADLTHVKVVLHSDMEDYRRRFNLEPLVRSVEDEELAKGRKRATVDEPCPKCAHPVLEFYTMQLRSADEGQTVFYECSNCGHKYSQNN